MDYKTAMKQIGRGSVQPVYVCYGPETYLLEEFVAHLADHWLEPEYREFSVSKYDLTETGLDAVLEDARTLPFMAERKLVIAKNALFFTASKDPGKIEHQTDRLLEYAKEPSEQTVLVFTVEAEKLDERKKLVKTFRDACIPFSPLSADELLQWVNRQAAKLNVTLADGAADHLILYAGTQLRQLARELEKLALYAGPNGTITGEAIERLVSRQAEQNVFALIDDIAHLRLQRAFETLRDLLNQREEPIKILLLIARQFRIIMQVKELARKGYSQQQIASGLGIHPYAVKIAAEQGKRYDNERLIRILTKLADLDYMMKSGKIDKVLGLELFLLELAS